MNKILLFFIFIIISLISVNIASACSCAQNPLPTGALQDSTAVFAGKVTNIEVPSGLVIISSADPVKVTFEVSKLWKGQSYKTLVVTTSRDGASCGYSFKEDEEYVVYTYGEENKLSTNICSRTKLLSNAQEDLAALGEGNIPTIEGTNVPIQSNFQQILWIIIGILVLVVVFFIIRKYRK